MARASVEVELIALVDQANKAVSKFAKDTQRQLDSVKLFTAISGVADGLRLAGDALRPIIDFLGDAISEAVEAEKASLRLANSMRIVGDFSTDALNVMEEYAQQLAETTALSDDQVVASLALAKTFGLTNKEARAVVSAAADLSAATGEDLNSSVEKLSKTYNGFIDRSLKQAIPALRELTEEQLAAGDAIELVGKRFAGSQAELRGGFGGAVNELSKAFNELKESIGSAITSSDLIVDSINALSATVKFAAENFDTFGKVAKTALIAVLNPTAAAAGLLEEAYKKLGNGNEQVLSDIEKIRLGASKAFAEGNLEASIKADRNALLAREKALEDFNKIRSQLEVAGLSEIEKINKDANDRIKVIRAAVDTGALKDASEAQRLIESVQRDRIKRVSEFEKKENERLAAEQKKLAEDAEKRIAEIAKNPLAALKLDLGIKLSAEQKDLAAVSAGFAGAILKGAAGAGELVSKAAGAFADTVLPGIGGAVGEIVGELAKGPDYVRQQVRAFVQALPGVLKNIVLAIPELVKEISKAIPQIVKELVAAVPEIVNELVRQMPEISAALAAQMPAVSVALVTGIVQNIPKIVEGFAKEFLKIPERFVDALLDALPGGNILGGGGDGGGVLGGIGGFFSDVGDFLGFEQGGTIVNPSFAGDKGLARVSDGETIVDKSLTDALRAFVNGGGGGGFGPQTIVIENKIGLDVLSRAIVDLKRNGYRVDA